MIGIESVLAHEQALLGREFSDSARAAARCGERSDPESNPSARRNSRPRHSRVAPEESLLRLNQYDL